MSIRFYNTLSRNTEEFQPLEPGRVSMYHCGPTVYSSPQIGNFRSFLLADLLRRFLEYRGFDVTQVMNITDVGHLRDDADEGEDKMEAAARKERLDPYQIAAKYTEEFFEGVDRLGIRRAHHYPKATDHIPEMIAMIEKLIDQGFAYVAPSGNVYFEVQKFESYGELSANTLEELNAGHRVERNPEKKNPHDFALWKRDPHHLMQWDAPWGRGFPGWHIECSAMSTKYLSETFDIHTGGEDNIFPHHECEIAQTEGATSRKFVNYWMHVRHLRVEGQKMAKSLGNFLTLEDLAQKGYTGCAVRFMLMKVHYRQPMNFTMEGMDEAQSVVDRLTQHASTLREKATDEPPDTDFAEAIDAERRKFSEAMDDDLNVSSALASVHAVVAAANRADAEKGNARKALDAIEEFDSVLGFLDTQTETSLDEEVERLIEERRVAREQKDWAAADRIRDELKAMNVELMDSKDGVRWRLIRGQ